MQLLYLEMTNFRSHEHTFLDLTSFESAVVTGENGAGKSSFAYAFCFCFWANIAKVKLADLIRTNALKMEVAVAFLHDDGNMYRMVRGVTVSGKNRTPKGYATLYQKCDPGLGADGQRVTDSLGNVFIEISENNVTLTNKKLDMLLGGLTQNTAIHANFDLQGESSLFMDSEASVRRKLFEQMLNLQIYDALEKLARSQVKRLKAELQVLDIDDTKEQSLEVEIAGIESEIEKIKTSIVDIQSIVDELVKRKHDLEAIVAAGISDLERRKAPLLTDLASIDQEITSTQARINVFEDLVAEKEHILMQYQNLQDKVSELKALQEARQAYTVAKGERKTLANTYGHHEGLVTQAKTEIARARDSLQTQSKRIKAEYSIDATHDNNSLIEQLQQKRIDFANELKEAQEQEKQLKTTLSELSDKQVAIGAAIASLETTESTLNTQIQKIKKSGALCPVFNTPCDKLTDEHKQAEIARLTESLNATMAEKQTHVQTKLECRNAIETTNKQLEQTINKEKKCTQIVGKLDNDINNYQQAMATTEATIVTLTTKMETASAEMVKIDAELDALDKSIIDTGFNPDYYTNLETAIKSLENAGWDKKRDQLLTAEATLGDVKKQAQSLAEKRQTLVAQIANIDIEIATQEEKIRLTKQDLTATNTTLDTNKVKLATLNTDQITKSKELGVIQTLLNQIREKKNRSLEVRKEIAAYTSLEKTYRDTRALIVENSVPRFQDLCNQILDYLDVNIRIRVETLDETKDNKTKETKFSPTFRIIVIDGNKGVERDYNTWSGGEKQRINLAIRQALSALLLNRAGIKMDLILIDESDSALDDKGKAALIKLIQASVEGRFGRPAKVMCITHTEDLKDAFPTRIQVKLRRDISKVSVVQ